MAVQQQHHPGPGGGELSQLSVGEMLAGIIVFAPLLAAIPLVLTRVRVKAWAWLVEHQLVVSTHTLPIFDGVGLDFYRILIGAGAAGLVLTAGYATLRRRQRRGPGGGQR